MGELKSSVEAAQAAISGFGGVKSAPMQISPVKVAQSNISSMKKGEELNKKLLSSAVSLKDKVVEVTEKIPAYASKVEADDLRDANQIRQVVPQTFGGGIPLQF